MTDLIKRLRSGAPYWKVKKPDWSIECQKSIPLAEALMVEAADALERTQWQDIETAPKDGEIFLAFQKDSSPRFFECFSRYDHRTDTKAWSTDFATIAKPTHWMPLPDPPE